MTMLARTSIRAMLGAAALALPLATADTAAALSCKPQYFITKATSSNVPTARAAAIAAWSTFVTNTAGLAWSAWDNAVDPSSVCYSDTAGTVCNAKAKPCLNDTVVISGGSQCPTGRCVNP